MARIVTDRRSELMHRHSILFIAFAEEEYYPQHSNYYHLGSLYAAQKLSASGGDPVAAVIALDMIASNTHTHIFSNFEIALFDIYIYILIEFMALSSYLS